MGQTIDYSQPATFEELRQRTLDLEREACERELAAWFADRSGAVDWAEVIESGGGPGLALGAERRLRRAPAG